MALDYSWVVLDGTPGVGWHPWCWMATLVLDGTPGVGWHPWDQAIPHLTIHRTRYNRCIQSIRNALSQKAEADTITFKALQHC